MTDNPTEKRFSGRIADYLPLIRATDGLTLSQVCALSSLGPATIQNWIKRGFVPHPVGKKYRERHLARILLIARLRECLQIDRIGALLLYINGDTDDESDDIITEEHLYDLFCDMTQALDSGETLWNRAGETADAAAGSLIDLSERERERISCALRVMAYGYAASRCKQEADRLYDAYIG